MTCETCQPQLLHYLFDVLDEDERREVQAHVELCETCRTGLARAREQQQLLKLAAKEQFPTVQFAPPATPSRLPMPASRGGAAGPRSRLWTRWAIAASVALLFVGGAGFGFYGWQQRQTQITVAEQKLLDARQAALNSQQAIAGETQRTREQIDRIRDQLRKIMDEWKETDVKVRRTLADNKVEVTVTGPKNLQPGGRNEYFIELKEAQRTPKKLPLQVRVVDATSNKPLFEKEILNQDTVKLDLPTNLPLGPEVEPVLEISAKLDDGQHVKLGERLPLISSRYVTHLATDRPMYRPGDVVRFRSLTLERLAFRPAKEDLQVRFAVTSPDGREIFKTEERAAQVRLGDAAEPIKGPDGQPVRGIAAGEFALPGNLAGGEYTLTVSEGQSRFPPEQRKFLVNRYERPRLNKEVTFHRKSYGPGDEVIANVKIRRSADGALVTAGLVANLRVDQHPPQTVQQPLKNGQATVKFTLPKNIDRGDGSLSVLVQDGGAPDPIVRPVPIVLNRLNVEFFAEGGDLIEGLPNRVYFQATTPLGKPADLRGRIVDSRGREVAKVQTLSDDAEPGVNQGMGLFQLVPQAGESYELKIDSPIGIEGTFRLADKLRGRIDKDGVVLTIPQGVVEDKINVALRSGGRERELMVGVYCRGRLLDASPVIAVGTEAVPVSLRASPNIAGVYRITVFEVAQERLIPKAERLIYRRPVEKLQIRIDSDQSVYQPGSPVHVSLTTTNEKKDKAAAILLVAVVDHSIVKLADEKTARSMPTQFYLGTEIRRAEDLEYADFLVGDHAKAATAIDLLLGTQGWRRFAEQKNLPDFVREQPQDGARFAGVAGTALQQTKTTSKLAFDAIDQKFGIKYVDTTRDLTRQEKAEVELRAKEEQERAVRPQVEAAAHQAIATARVHMEEYRERLLYIGLALGMLVVVAVGVVLVLMGLTRQARRGGSSAPYLAGGFSVLGMAFLIGLFGTVYLMSRGDRGQLGDARFGLVGRKQVAMPPPLAEPNADLLAKADKMQEGAAPLAANEAFRGMPKAPAPPPLPGPGGLGAFGPAMPMAKNGARAALAPGAALKKAEARDDVRLQMAPLLGLEQEKQNRRRFALADRAPGPGRPMREGFALGAAPGERLAGKHFADGLALRRVLSQQLGREVVLAAALDPCAVREYAHVHQTSPDNVRRDFAETLYWHPVVVLPDGKAEVRFDLSDAVTQFQVLATGHTLDGRLGSQTIEITSQLPASIQPIVPVEVSSSDKITVPVNVTNNTRESLPVNLNVEAAGLKVQEGARAVEAPPGQSTVFFKFEPAATQTEAKLQVRADFNGLSDAVERTFTVVPEGFPVTGAYSGMLTNATAHEVAIPPNVVKDTFKCQVQIYPSALADLQKGLESLLREPHGCFEQSSSSNYPNVLILNYLQETKQNRPEMEKRARELIDSGYRKLTSFECVSPQDRQRRGYEWFGQTAPPHEALTAYGLLQFRDMAKVHPVEAEMVERTRKYLLGQRDGQGGFRRNARALDSFGRAPDHITNAYIVWALTEAGDDTEISTELKALVERARKSEDPYFLSLVGLSLLNRKQSDDAAIVLKTIASKQKDDGRLEGTETSITSSGGRNLQIETTALATLAWLRANDAAKSANKPLPFVAEANKAAQWLAKQRSGFGGFGATQATILALKALVAHARESTQKAEAADLVLVLNNDPKQPEKLSVTRISAGAWEPIAVDLPSAKLRPGTNKIELVVDGNASLPYSLSWSYRTQKPTNPENCPVHLTTRLDRADVAQGETVKLSAIVENNSGKGQGMTVAVIGLPAGLTVPEDFAQLKQKTRLPEDGSRPEISFWELRGRELVLYWRDLAPAQKIEVRLDLICRLPGEYRGPASRAYLYYNPDLTHWTEPLAIQIAEARK